MRTTRPFDLHYAPLHRPRASLFRRRLLSLTVTHTPRRRGALGYPTLHASWPLDAGNPYARCISSPRLDPSRTSLSSVGGASLQDPHAARTFLHMLFPVGADLSRLADGFWNCTDAERMGRGGDEDERVRRTAGVRAPTTTLRFRVISQRAGSRCFEDVAGSSHIHCRARELAPPTGASTPSTSKLASTTPRPASTSRSTVPSLAPNMDADAA
ncbi:hypothetical protein B0H14DRAFT_1634458 [Mycena olivaceomarginata]|nr:hypothetical protein B0H14DRAFT_1634458 [Mycena olivaceomarginata]